MSSTGTILLEEIPLYIIIVIEWTYQAEGVAAGDSDALEGVERTPEEVGHGVEPGSEEVGHDSEEAGLESVVAVAWLVAALAAGTEEHWLEQAKEHWQHYAGHPWREGERERELQLCFLCVYTDLL